MDVFTHAVYSIIFNTDSTLSKYTYHYLSNISNIIHLFLCIWHIMKFGQDSSSMKLTSNDIINKLDGISHIFTFTQMYFQIISNVNINIIYCNIICLLIVAIYIPVRKINLIW